MSAPPAIPKRQERGNPPFATLRAFEAVGRLGGVRRAAQTLGLDRAVVSRHLRALEQWSGVALIDRDRSGALLTEQGRRYHARITKAFAEIDAATGDLLRNADGTRLRVWCVPGLALRWLMGRIGSLCTAYPEIDLELHPTDASPDFGHDEADADLRYVPSYRAGPPPLPNVRTLEIDRPVVIPVASPAYLAKLREPLEHAADFMNLPLLHEESHDNWSAWFEAQGIACAPQLSGPRLWHAHLTVEAACRGQGIALANHFLFRDDILTGRLVPVRIGGEAPPNLTLGTYVLSMRNDRWDSPVAARFRQWLRKAVVTHRQLLSPTSRELIVPREAE